jgi:PIN domain nuclease of toxin-antitoxin system
MRLLLDTHVFLWYIIAEVAQALQHRLTFARVDPDIADYPVPLLPKA